MFYSIGQMAKLSGLTASTLRYYDKIGILSFVERDENGIRVFKDEDYEWLKIIVCLKKTGMPLAEIREFVEMAIKGDETIKSRLELVKRQREVVRKQLEETMTTLDILDYKCWYYETAYKSGTTSVPKNISDSDIEEKFVRVRKYLKEHK